jgi:hypothetical protein
VSLASRVPVGSSTSSLVFATFGTCPIAHFLTVDGSNSPAFMTYDSLTKSLVVAPTQSMQAGVYNLNVTVVFADGVFSQQDSYTIAIEVFCATSLTINDTAPTTLKFILA